MGEKERSMCTITFRAALLAALVSAAFVHAQTWQLVWNDEFNYTGLPDSTKWDYEVGAVRNSELQYYTRARIDNASVSGGSLDIVGRRESYQGMGYTAASIITKGISSWTCGRIEVRAKVPGGRGTWPAIWMLGDNIDQVGWPRCGEIDIMEYVGFDANRIYGTVHYATDAAGTHGSSGASVVVNAPYDAYHVYAIEWFADRIDIYVDAVKYHTYTNDNSGGPRWPFDKPFYLLINLAIGGSWGGQQGIDTTIFPIHYPIDYARVYVRSYPGPYTLSTASSGGGTVAVSPARALYDSASTVRVTAMPDAGFEFTGWSGDTSGTANPVDLTMTRNKSLLARFARPCELLRNGAFSEGMRNWSLYCAGATVASDSAVGDTCRIGVTTAGTNYWDMQFVQTGLQLTQGTSYRLSLDAWAVAPYTLRLAVNKAYSPWTGYFSAQASLSTSARTFTYEFTANADETNARVEFDFGSATGTVFLDNVSLACVTNTGVQSRAGSRSSGRRMPQRFVVRARGDRVAAVGFDLHGREIRAGSDPVAGVMVQTGR
jgi:beta-glucanase (GH16 family)